MPFSPIGFFSAPEVLHYVDGEGLWLSVGFSRILCLDLKEQELLVSDNKRTRVFALDLTEDTENDLFLPLELVDALLSWLERDLHYRYHASSIIACSVWLCEWPLSLGFISWEMFDDIYFVGEVLEYLEPRQPRTQLYQQLTWKALRELPLSKPGVLLLYEV